MNIADDADRLQTLLYSAYDSDTVRDMERPLLDDGVPLMRMAASAAAHVTMTLLDDEGLTIEDARVTLLVGAGDNGGDGLYVGAELANEGAHVTAIAVGRSLHEELSARSRTPEPRSRTRPRRRNPRMHHGLLRRGSRRTAAGRSRVRPRFPCDHRRDDRHWHKRRVAWHRRRIASSLGFDGELPDRPALPNNEPSSDLPLVVAIDTPSGVGVNDGSLPGPYIPADVTVTFGAMKPCAMVPPASYACGHLTLVDFGFDIDDCVPATEMTDGDFVTDSIRLPQLSDGKYSRGVVGLVTGSARYPGAAVLSSAAAARTNTGMVRYLGPQRTQDMVLSSLPEAVIGKGRVQSWVVAPAFPQAMTKRPTPTSSAKP